jgi:hypothetical protein
MISRGTVSTARHLRLNPPTSILHWRYCSPTPLLPLPRQPQKCCYLVILPDDEDEHRPLIKLLGCRLQAQAAVKRVNTIERLREATGPCDKPSP